MINLRSDRREVRNDRFDKFRKSISSGTQTAQIQLKDVMLGCW